MKLQSSFVALAALLTCISGCTAPSEEEAAAEDKGAVVAGGLSPIENGIYDGDDYSLIFQDAAFMFDRVGAKPAPPPNAQAVAFATSAMHCYGLVDFNVGTREIHIDERTKLTLPYPDSQFQCAGNLKSFSQGAAVDLEDNFQFSLTNGRGTTRHVVAAGRYNRRRENALVGTYRACANGVTPAGSELTVSASTDYDLDYVMKFGGTEPRTFRGRMTDTTKDGGFEGNDIDTGEPVSLPLRRKGGKFVFMDHLERCAFEPLPKGT